jgi:hypothetical protein
MQRRQRACLTGIRALVLLGVLTLTGVGLSSTASAVSASTPTPVPTATATGPTTAGPSSSAAQKPTTAATSGPVTWGTRPADSSEGKNRSHFDYELAPGTRVTDALAVTNLSDRPITLTVYAGDALTTPDGGIDLMPAGSKPVDVGSWITMKQPTITVPAQATVLDQFTLSIPVDATPGDHSGGVVTSLVTSGSADGVRVDHRLGSRVYVRVDGALTPQLSVSDVKLDFSGTPNPLGGGSSTVSYTVRNTGNVRLSAHQAVSISGIFGWYRTTATPPDVPEILPGNSLTVVAPVAGVWPAFRLSAAVSLQPVGDELTDSASIATAESESVWAFPWSLVGVVLIIAALVALYIWRRRRWRARTDAAIREAVEALATPVEPSEPSPVGAAKSGVQST